jgi:FecR protein
MRRLRSPAALATALLAGFSVATSAEADRDKIGGAVVVEREVSGSLPGAERKVAQGDDVFLDELIRTAGASAAKLQFVDETKLSLGPLASVKLDSYVFNPDRTAKAMAVTMTKGAMRWVSGISPSAAYKITTPQATIGVRGTIFDLVADGRRTIVVLQEGLIEVCTTGARRKCKMLSRRGDVITVTGNALEGPRPGGPGQSDFASRCLSAASRNCTVMASAEPAPARAKTRLSAKPPAIEPPPRRRVVAPRAAAARAAAAARRPSRADVRRRDRAEPPACGRCPSPLAAPIRRADPDASAAHPRAPGRLLAGRARHGHGSRPRHGHGALRRHGRTRHGHRPLRRRRPDHRLARRPRLRPEVARRSDEGRLQALGRERRLHGRPRQHPLGERAERRQRPRRARHRPAPADQHEQIEVRGRKGLLEEPRPRSELIRDRRVPVGAVGQMGAGVALDWRAATG